MVQNSIMSEDRTADRYITLADQPELIPLLADWFYREWGSSNPGSSREKMVRVLRGSLNVDSIPQTIVLLRGSKPVATASLKIQEMNTHPYYTHWLGGVYVHPDFREQGIGSQLVEYSARVAKQLLVENLYLYTRGHAAFYARLGWQEIERTLYEGRKAIIMKRNLTIESAKEK
jgi:N-acetylglutamate synthase-like GNAT family acetyltransferase